MLKWLLLMAVAFLHVLTATRVHRKLCVNAKKECERNIDCALAYLRFRGDCPHIVVVQMDYVYGSAAMLPKPRNCSKDCVRAIEELNKTKKGARLYDCDCQLDGDCLTMKARVTKCLNPDHARNTRTSCTMARTNCSRVAACKKLQDHFLRDCNSLINGVECEGRCMKAQNKLFKCEQGKPLLNCECDGIYEPFCRALEAHAEQLRCKPGMDGSGTPAFEYNEGSIRTDVIFGVHDNNNEQEDMKNHSWVPVNPYLFSWALVLLVTLLLY